MRLLRACLLDEPLPRLMAMADLWDASLEVSSAREVAEVLALHMLQPGIAQQARNELPQEARAALDALLQAKGKMPSAAFERRFGAVRPMGPGKLERERPWLSPTNAAEILWYRGFIFRAFDRAINNPSEMAFVPSDLAEVLSPQSSVLSPSTPQPLSPQTVHVAANSSLIPHPSSLLDDVTTLLIYIQNNTVKVRANGEWTNEARAALIPMLRDSDGVEDNRASGRFVLLLFLMGQLGWIRTQEGRARLNSQPVTHWLQSDVDTQRQVLFEAWLNSREWNDLAHVDGLSLEMTHAWANDPLRERRVIVELMQREIGDWRLEIADEGNLQSPISNLKSANPDFARPDGRYDTWHVRDVATGEFLNGFENWERVEGRLIRYVVEGPLSWLEANQLDKVTGGQGDKERAVPLSPLPLVSLSAEGIITIAAESRFQRFQLARVADWAGMGEGSFTYRLTPRSMARAQEQGILPLRVIEFLEQNTGKPLPPSVLKAIQRWAERGPEARIERVRLIKTKDGPTMELLLTNPNIRRVMLERLAPNCIAVKERDAKAIAAEIVQSGLLVD